MIEKENINNIISKCTYSVSSVLKEYMLLPANVFFRHNIKYAEEYLGEKEADRYRAYMEKIKIEFSPFSADEEVSDNPYLKDIVAMGLKKRNKRLSEAIMYAVFVYPQKIIREKNQSLKS